MKKIKFSSKAKTLQDLSKILKSAKILPIYKFKASDYKKSKFKIIKNIKKKFKENIIVRSSSGNEDNLKNSNAGRYVSVMDVEIKNHHSLEKSIDQVVNSFKKNKNKYDEVFIQPMLKSVQMSGVIFNCDIDTLSPYFIVNYDESGSTDSVTSGSGTSLKSFICFKKKKKFKNEKLKKIIKATEECEKIFNYKYLDIEFAFSNNKLFLLQVRALVTKNKEDLSSLDLSNNLNKLKKKIKKLNSHHPNLLGNKTIFSVMTDWNPAEIIGLRPKMLALSLYKELITDETWAYQRDNYGYRRLRSHPLLVSFLGVPFIDVRVSFNSFIPKSLDDKIASKLVNYYLNQLIKNLNKHDKVEFEIIFSCCHFGLKNKLSKLLNYKFTKLELKLIEKSLLSLTNNIINVKNGLYKKDLEKSKILNQKFSEIKNSQLSLIDKIYWLIKDVKRYGTLPFAGIARAAFIAVQILRSFVDAKILNKQEYDKFLNSLNTVSKQLSNDTNILSKNKFLKIYGHLRPGTYDILSPRYDEFYEKYFSNQETKSKIIIQKFDFSKSQKIKINKFIKKNKLDTDFYDLIKFIKESIEGREYLKFLFSKHLSQILKYIEKLGKKYNFSKNDLAFLDIHEIINLYSSLDQRDLNSILQTNIKKNKIFYKHTKAIKLPNIITNEDNIYSFYLEENEPNFISMKRIKSNVTTEDNLFTSNLEGKIVCIKSADPGYDYLFSKNIGALLTCFGGANSHMAIRCAELGIPAVIGCGENAFKRYCLAKTIEIDAANKKVIIF